MTTSLRAMPALETGRLVIRNFTREDLSAAHRMFDEEGPQGMTLAERREWLEWTVLNYKYLALLDQPPYGDRAFVLKSTDELIGSVGIVPYLDSFGQIAAFGGQLGDPATAQVGLYWFTAVGHRRQGFAVEAARAIASYLFTHERIGRLIATTGYQNLSSQAVMRKLGMIVEHAKQPQPPDIFVVGVLDRSQRR